MLSMLTNAIKNSFMNLNECGMKGVNTKVMRASREAHVEDATRRNPNIVQIEVNTIHAAVHEWRAQ